mgnify:CR=1 FL=1
MTEDSRLTVTAPAPDWFHWALDYPMTEHVIDVEGCPIHYLRWPTERPQLGQRGVLLVHGGGAHAHWWRYVAPFLARTFNVAALDLSGMGDSGRRDDYDTTVRAAEIRAVLAAADLGPLPFVVGHSFGGFMTMKFGSLYGPEIGGAVIVDSPIRSPREQAEAPLPPPPMGKQKFYPDFETALGRFRLMPAQTCDNDFIVEYIGRHSLMETDRGWTWKFDPEAMGARRFGEPFNEYLQAVRCRAALMFGERSALVSRETAAYMSELMGPLAPIVEIPEAQHHVMLDQPLAFVAAARTLLESWSRG